MFTDLKKQLLFVILLMIIRLYPPGPAVVSRCIAAWLFLCFYDARITMQQSYTRQHVVRLRHKNQKSGCLHARSNASTAEAGPLRRHS